MEEIYIKTSKNTDYCEDRADSDQIQINVKMMELSSHDVIQTCSATKGSPFSPQYKHSDAPTAPLYFAGSHTYWLFIGVVRTEK